MSKKKLGCLVVAGSIVVAVWAARNWISLVVVLAIGGATTGIILWLRRRRKQLRLTFEEKQKRLELEQYSSEKQRLISEGAYKYVESFVKNYSMVNSEEEIWKLKELLEQKGFVFNRTQISWLLDEETKQEKYSEFTSKIGFGNPQNLDGFIVNLIEGYGENWFSYRELFVRFLTEERVPFIDSQLEARIHDLKHRAEIARFEARLASNHSGMKSIQELDSMTGSQFEVFLKDLFEKMGYKVDITAAPGDQGADLVLRKMGEITLLQAKRWNTNVTNAAVQEVAAAVKHHGGHRGMVVTTSYFTVSAKELAKSNSVELIDRNELQRLINNYYPNVAAGKTINCNVTVKRSEIER